ncbi:hypothetical protein DSO57_1025902 [Entomophthora muscae]|uniref:Uncharacterized protein n=1 Tax=Entomophthora muscae TaxID=34485 RepID=A0ACC2RGT5_9FUNG|nr:hypothetical protein DSO57_1025902 [Entomophthora muscae]
MSLVSLALAASFKQIVSFGDSITDTGNLYRMTSGRDPSRQEYYNGRFSNGPTWVEYLAKLLKASLVDQSYGGATSDMNMDRSSGVPGCIQQVDGFARSSKRTNDFNATLVTIVFQGNDFFLPRATAQEYMRNMDLCLHKVLGLGYKYVMVSTSNAPEVTPAFPMSSFIQRRKFTSITDQLPAMWNRELQQVKREFNDVTFYTMNLKGKMHTIT